ncbi:MAG: class I SAM-dependent methyltransferase [Marinobacter sp.]
MSALTTDASTWVPPKATIARDFGAACRTYNPAASLCRSSAGVVTGAESLPQEDNSVDVVFSNLMIQWCSHPARVLSECQRVLKPGGRLKAMCRHYPRGRDGVAYATYEAGWLTCRLAY